MDERAAVRKRLLALPFVDDISLFGTRLHVRGKEKTGASRDSGDSFEKRVTEALAGIVPPDSIRRVSPTLEDSFVLFSERDNDAEAV